MVLQYLKQQVLQTSTAEFGASIDIGNSGADTQSNLQAASTYAGEARLSSDWMYASFVEAATEKDGTSTGIALGAGTGKSSQVK